ncbi:RimJ/RimL family protein N-acetyltransferase [Nonomuraea polychroma]|uniref:RimJ/RimL family protein N-acetyltransferase n=1 Tax=Nonomuraea polychroma TaxID=46176 RepID=A0A438LXF8_9ACTN|nr:GNAT family N-acetyltransferase [Nonomuraea polychroma]RVX38180.1 RimJ/RimL family protein N-acetyltransferase [Nonomuraea polychroma]
MEVVQTARMLLSRVTGDDLPAVHELHSDSRTSVYNPSGPSPDLESSRAMLDLWLADWDERGLGYWAARLLGEPEVIGFGGLRHAVVDGEHVLNLYYRFRPSAWGHGYALELAEAALRVGKRLGTVVAVIRDTNAPSRRVAERAGMRRDRTIPYGGVPSDVYVA